MLTKEEIIEHIEKGELICIYPSFGNSYYQCSLKETVDILKNVDFVSKHLTYYKWKANVNG